MVYFYAPICSLFIFLGQFLCGSFSLFALRKHTMYRFNSENFQLKNLIFLLFVFKTKTYTLEPPCRGGTNEYPQSMLWSKNMKNRNTPEHHCVTIYKWDIYPF